MSVGVTSLQSAQKRFRIDIHSCDAHGEKPKEKPKSNQPKTKKQPEKDKEKEVKDPWLFTTLKGHTGIINSMDYSTNGKYLATCAGVVHRHRKPPPLETLLRPYVLTPSQLCTFGYPIESGLHPGQVIIYRHARRQRNLVTYNVKAQLNSSGGSSASSGSGSGSDSDDGFTSIPTIPNFIQGMTTERKCTRCFRGFFITNNEYLTQEKCVYHWGKLQSHGYTCCGSMQSAGCTAATSHVWQGVTSGCNGPYGDYIRMPPPYPLQPGHQSVVALDCEMCFTVEGLELSKVTFIAADGSVLYDSYVRPENRIVDFNTRFSGITSDDIYGPTSCAKSLSDVHADMARFITSATILVGHGLENDLRALKLIHECCIDTAIVFPHKFGVHCRRSLKSLAASILGWDIQTLSSGHDSHEDAFVAMELILWRVRKDLQQMQVNVHHGPQLIAFKTL
ncbi:putative exonuclease GOR isoform X3 [Atheta coriaria]|uniref:putative exonuclease GOR isoform X3 n=1 Tax=Dalotia coriaria TaxID=877792 RepID=UPI0031F363AB